MCEAASCLFTRTVLVPQRHGESKGIRHTMAVPGSLSRLRTGAAVGVERMPDYQANGALLGGHHAQPVDVFGERPALEYGQRTRQCLQLVAYRNAQSLFTVVEGHQAAVRGKHG